MAKRTVLDHPKFMALKADLRQPKGPVLGWLEALWHFCAKFTPQGNLGKYTNAAIEAWVEWDGEPGELINALLRCGWLDNSAVHRLVVHDWHEHADEAVKKALKRAKLWFVDAATGQCLDTGGGNGKTPSARLPALPEPEPRQAPPEPRLASPAAGGERCEGEESESIPDQARTIYFTYGARRWGPDWPDSADLERPQARKDLRSLESRLRAYPEAGDRLVAYLAQPPPGRCDDEKLWQIFEYLHLDSRHRKGEDRDARLLAMIQDTGT
jgi:hypothetical protein